MAGASNTNNEIVRSILELDKICRTCLEIKEDMIPLFEHLTATMLMAITKVEVAVGDGLPSQLCLQCVTQISRCHSFKLAVEKNDIYLREHVSLLALEQLKREQDEINEYKPVSLCSVSRDMVMMDHDYTTLEHDVIKMEEVDLEPDYIERNTRVDMELNDADNCDIKVEVNDDKRTVPLFDYAEDSIDDETNHETLQYDSGDTEINLHISDMCNASRPFAHSLTQFTIAKHASSRKPNTTHKQRATKTYSCSKCAYRCMNQSTLTRHNMETHSGKVYSCELCDYKCERKTNLRSHMRIHIFEKSFSCYLCDYNCKDSETLKTHMSIHTGENQSTYNYNSYKTTEKSNWLFLDDEEQFSCSKCDYKCEGNDMLAKHKRTMHNEIVFLCNYCDYKTTFPSDCEPHARVHTGEKPFSLTGQMKIQDGPFTCDVCNSKLLTKQYLKWHMRTHAGEKLCYFRRSCTAGL